MRECLGCHLRRFFENREEFPYIVGTIPLSRVRLRQDRNRFVREEPSPQPLSATVWINPPQATTSDGKLHKIKPTGGSKSLTHSRDRRPLPGTCLLHRQRRHDRHCWCLFADGNRSIVVFQAIDVMHQEDKEVAVKSMPRRFLLSRPF